MSTKPDDGGPAFPRPVSEADDDCDNFYPGSQGMSLRQWYAGMALQGMLVEGFQPNGLKRVQAGTFNYPAAAFELADEMLAEDARTKP